MSVVNLRRKVRATIFDINWSLLVCRIPSHYGVTWEIPGGGIDSDGSPFDALKREVWEETGITEFRVVGITKCPTEEIWEAAMKANWKDSYEGQLISEYVLQIDRSEPVLIPGATNEVAELWWIDPRDVSQILVYRDQCVVFERVCREVLGTIPTVSRPAT